MPLPPYERLRMTHRSLLKTPPSRPELHALLDSLPATLDVIGGSRPALSPELARTRQQLRLLEAELAHPTTPDLAADELARRLHHALAGLFGP